MPYSSVSDLPKSVKDNLPAGAQKIWMDAYNRAHKKKDDFPDAASRAQYAWGAVKKVYKKNDKGNWVKKKKMSLSGYTNDEFSMSMPSDPAGWARLYFQITPEDWVLLDSKEQQDYIDQIPAMLSDTFVKLASLAMQLDVYTVPEDIQPSIQERINWMEQDVNSIWARLWGDKEKVDIEFAAINKRIDDLITIFSGVRTLAKSNLSAELMKLGDRLLDLDIKIRNEETDIGQSVDWMKDDISSIWSEIYANREMADDQIEAINKRIDDLIMVFTGIKKVAAEESKLAAGTPKTDAERAIDHFFDGDKEKWDELTDEEKKEYIAKLPKPGQKRKNMTISSVQCGEPNIHWEKVGSLLKITGTLIAEGTWTGLDGQTVYYPGTIFSEAAPSILNGAIKRGHGTDDESVIGFINASRPSDKKIEIEGIIFDKDSIEDVVGGEIDGISMEADIHAEMDENKGCYVATSMDLRKATLVKNPACASCRIDTASAVSLERQQIKRKRKIMSSKYTLYAKPSEVEFFTFLGQKLKEAGLEEGVTDDVVSAMRDAVELPEIMEPGTPPNTELADLRKEFDDLKTRFDEATESLAEKTSELESKEAELTEKVNEATSLSAKLDDIKKAELAAMLSRIKEIDKEFDEKELLEDVESLDKQKVLLTKYLGTLVKLASKTNLTVDTGSVTEDKVKEVLLGMGITDVKQFIER